MKEKLKKPYKVLIIIMCVVLISPLIGLMATGYSIGWGPFATFRYYNKKCYSISDTKYPYQRIKKTIKGKNGNINGYLYLADHNGEKQQIVILSHGLATEMWHNINTAVSLANSGISVFMFDYCGGSIHSTSDGNTTDMSVLTEKQDLNDVIDEIKIWDFVDTDRIGIIGYSQGGLVAAMTAVERDDIERLCLLYPAFPAYDEIRNSYKTPDDVPETLDRNGMLTGRIYYTDILNFDAENIYEYCGTYSGKVLFIHGTDDQLVDYESTLKAMEYYKNDSLLTIEGAGHGFTGDDDLNSVKAEYEFFSEYNEVDK